MPEVDQNELRELEEKLDDAKVEFVLDSTTVNYLKIVDVEEDLGLYWYRAKEYEKSLEYFTSALEHLKNVDQKKSFPIVNLMIGQDLTKIANINIRRNIYKETIDILKEAKNYLETYQVNGLEETTGMLQTSADQLIAAVENDLGICYFFLEEYDKALEAYERNLALRKRIVKSDDSIENLRYLSQIYVKIAATLEKLDRNEEAMKNYKKALEVEQKLAEKLGIGQVLNNACKQFVEEAQSLEKEDKFYEAGQEYFHAIQVFYSGLI